RLTVYFGQPPAHAQSVPSRSSLPRHEPFTPRGSMPSGPAPRVHGGAALAMDPAPVPRMLPVRHAAVPRAAASAWKRLLGPLPAALAPTEKHRLLQAALVWGDQLLGVEHLRDSPPLTVGGVVAACTFQVLHHALGKAFALPMG